MWRVLMLGWEFPPYISGGLGTACEGLTRAMAQRNVRITFVLPRPIADANPPHVKLLAPAPGINPGTAPPTATISANGRTVAEPLGASGSGEKITFRIVPTQLSSPYAAFGSTSTTQRSAAHTVATPRPASSASPLHPPVTARYDGDLITQAKAYADLCLTLAQDESFDLVHAHDWLTFPAAMAIAAATGKPFVAHVYSTEFDRAGEHHIHEQIFEIERRGTHAATRVMAVSHLTRRIMETRYALDPEKIDVVYNGIDVPVAPDMSPPPPTIRSTDKIVLFLGRITMQKGPEYFIAAAKKVLSVTENVKFVMAGAGDKVRDVIDLAAREGIGGKVLFTGFLRGGDVHRVFDMADVFVMPSVSEPFGLAALEAMSHDVPVILSKQSGVSEVVRNALKVDFWDTTEMANKIIAVLRHPPLARTLTEQADIEVRRLTWTGAADKCLGVYDRAMTVMAV